MSESEYSLDFNIPSIVKNINYLRNKENFEGLTTLSGWGLLILVFILIGITLLVWAIVLLITVKLPLPLLIICIIFMFVKYGGTLLFFILTYLYK